MARIRDDGDKLIELFAEVALPKEVHTDAFILQTYPRDYSNKEVLSSVPSFAYPCAFRCEVVTHFSFVLTNINSKWTFGYCRHTPKSDTCLVILSDLPWHSTFYRILDHCAELAARQSSIPLEHFLEAMYTGDLPQPGLELNITYTCEDLKLREFRVACQDHQKLPCIPEDRNVTEYFSAVNASNMIAIFASMLNERRIVITSDRLSRLSACVQAANALIYPMHWQHIFIPLLPSHLLDYLSAPMPFLVGVPQATLATVRRSELVEVVLLNADTNQLTTPYDDVNSLPSEVLHSLRKALKSNGNGSGSGGSSGSSAAVNGGAALGDGLSRAFMRALVSLIGGYRSALRIVPGEQITFDRELFLSSSGGGLGGASRSTSRQLFLERLLQLQIFQQFIETRLDLFNAGQRLDDQFEMELNTMETSSGVNSRFRAQYREWAAVMKKEGGAFLRAVNPKVKSAISKSKQAVRTLRSKIGTNQNGSGGSGGGGGGGGSGGSSNGGSPASQRQNSSTPSSPKLPPKIKKSISGTAISQTSRTVTYVRTPNSVVSTAGVGKNSQHRSPGVRMTPNGGTSTPTTTTATTHSSSRSSTLSVPSYASSSSIAPSASSESSDVDEMDSTAFGGAPGQYYSSSVPRVDMNITAELESIFRNKATLATASAAAAATAAANGTIGNGGTSSTQRPLLTTNNNSSSHSAPIPPPRTNNNNNANSSTDKFGHLNRHSLKPATLALAKQAAAEQAAASAGGGTGKRSSAPEKCLIEFDSPPKDGLSPNGSGGDQRNKAASSALGALVHFDPLLEGSYGQQTGTSPPGAQGQQQSTASFYPQQPPPNSGHLFFPNNGNNGNHTFANNFSNGNGGNFYGNGQMFQQPPPPLYPVLRSNGHNMLQRAPPMTTATPSSAFGSQFQQSAPPPLPPPSSTLASNVNVMALRGRFEMTPFSTTAAAANANNDSSGKQPPLVTAGAAVGAGARPGTVAGAGNPFQAHCWQEFD